MIIRVDSLCHKVDNYTLMEPTALSSIATITLPFYTHVEQQYTWINYHIYKQYIDMMRHFALGFRGHL